MVASVTSKQSADINLATKIAAGSSGINFQAAQPEITFLYNTRFVQTLNDVSVPTDKSNVGQIELTYVASPDGTTLLTDAKGNVVRDQSPLNNPKIVLNPPREGIYGFNVKILATNDNLPPKRVTVIAHGCQKSSMCLNK